MRTLSAPRITTRANTTAALATVAIAAGSAVVVLAVATQGERLQRWDDDLERRVAPHRARAHVLASLVTQPGEWYVHPLMGAAAALAVLRLRAGPARRVVIPLAVASLGSMAAHHAVKFVHRRPRPEAALRRNKAEAAFPSGHTANATAVLGTSGYVLVREGIVRLPIALAGGGALAVATGMSRVALGWHWGTDVLGGWLTGVAVAALAAELYEAMSES